ncbi:adenylyl-sulfate kinase [Bacillus massiliigorillae]|uniref:adenylyl-sulfate kinase n=1 Tax=Bacillus massiliigorillae TaxID=1243664 RepID=UPI00039E75CB|nr:adenylyl-sulfate kinase [Bacillus massiliigorillae]
MEKNITWHASEVHVQQRRIQNAHHSFVIWFTGLSGSGKSTIANELAAQLFSEKISVYVLDGDNIRHGLNSDLGFSELDRTENIRRIAEVSKLFIDNGTIAITAFISPFQEDRNQARAILQNDEFIEVYIKCPLDACEERDPKGLYKKARNGEIKQFTGIDSPYEEPVNPELVIDTAKLSIGESVNSIIAYLKTRKFI